MNAESLLLILAALSTAMLLGLGLLLWKLSRFASSADSTSSRSSTASSFTNALLIA